MCGLRVDKRSSRFSCLFEFLGLFAFLLFQRVLRFAFIACYYVELILRVNFCKLNLMIRTIIKIRILCRLHFLHYGLPTLEISLRTFLKYEGGV